MPSRSITTPIRCSAATTIVASILASLGPPTASARVARDDTPSPIILPDPTPDPWGSIGSAALLTPSWIVVGVREKRQLDATRELHSFGGILFWPRACDGRPSGAPLTAWPLAPLRGARFGESLAVDGERLLVGEPGFRADPIIWRAQGRAQIVDLSQPVPLAIEIIERPLGVPEGPLENGTGMEFGAAVSLSGNTALIGAPGLRLPGSGDQVGGAFLHERAHNDTMTPLWPVVSVFLDPLATDGGIAPIGARFGSAVALHPTDVLVGAPASVVVPSPTPEGSDGNDIAPGHGRVVVFDRSTAVLLATLEAPNPALGDRFGSTITLEGNRAAIAAPGDECGFGSVHLFERDPALGWTHRATLTPPTTEEDGWIGFGNSVSLSGGRVLVGTGGIRSETAFGHRAALFRLTAHDARSGASAEWALEAILEGDASLPTGAPVALDSSGALLGEASIGFGQMRYWPIPRSPDLDGDGLVGPSDLSILLGAWGTAPGASSDLSGDGVVDRTDLALLIGGWS